ncbi:MAG: ABC transporter substrate-binding protein [Alphaproteobacteria bacterium]|nr:ABC transporter substrate-binding protein [Alphaproteobacteria bacterium]
MWKYITHIQDAIARRTLRIIDDARFIPHADKKIFFVFTFFVLILVASILGKLNSLIIHEQPVISTESLKEGILHAPIYYHPWYASTQSEKDISVLLHRGLVDRVGSTQTRDVLGNCVQKKIEAVCTLNPKAFFHDGTPVTTEDVIFSYNAVLQTPLKDTYKNITVEKIGDGGVRIINTNKDPLFARVLTLPILPEYVWKKVPVENWSRYRGPGAFIGTGPYTYQQAHLNLDGKIEYITLTAYNAYVLQRPFIKTIVLYFYDTAEEIISAHKKGVIDSFYSFNPTDTNALEKINDSEVTSFLSTRVFGIFFLAQSRYSTEAYSLIRSVLSSLIDREEIINNVFVSHAKKVFGPIAEDTTPITESIAVENVLTSLDKVGWKVDPLLQVRKKGSRVLALNMVILNTPDMRHIGEILKEQLAKHNITLTIDATDIEYFSQIIETKKYDLALIGYNAPTPNHFYNLIKKNNSNKSFISTLSNTREEITLPGPDLANYPSSIFTELEQLNSLSLDNNQQNVIYNSIKGKIARGVPAVFLYSPNFLYLTTPKIQQALKRSEQAHSALSRRIIEPHDRFVFIADWYTAIERVWTIFKN